MKTTDIGITDAAIELIRRDDYGLLEAGTIHGDHKLDGQQAELADGSVITVEVVGPVEVRFENRKAITAAMVIPGEAETLLGAIPMQSMDGLIDPKQERLMVNPKSPDRARMLLK